MEVPRIFVNAKSYSEATGEPGLGLARRLDAAAGGAGVLVGYAPPPLEVGRIAGAGLRALQIWAPHTDTNPSGASTGWVAAAAVRSAGAAGSILNHAEHKLSHGHVSNVVARLREAKLAVLLCADGLQEAHRLAMLQPEALAIEPPELIGGDISVTTADPRIVADGVELVRSLNASTKTLCGAGVKSAKDVRKAVELGAHGVLVASGVIKAKDPGAALSDLIRGL